MIPHDPKTRPWERKPENIWGQKHMGWWQAGFIVAALSARWIWSIEVSFALMGALLIAAFGYRFWKGRKAKPSA